MIILFTLSLWARKRKLSKKYCFHIVLLEKSDLKFETPNNTTRSGHNIAAGLTALKCLVNCRV